MTSYLPAECLHQIFEELKDDKEYLHSCLLVNRHWCKNIIDILWKQPFRFLYTCKKEICQCNNNNEKVIKRQFQAYNLVETYLSCFMFNEELKMINSFISRNEIPNYKRPIFNYIQFLKYMDFEELHTAIIDWIQFAATNTKTNNAYISFGDIFSPIWNWIGFSSPSLSFILSSSSNNDSSIILFKYLANNILNYKLPQNNDQLNDWVAIIICKLLMRNKKNSLISISIEVEMNVFKSGKFRCKHLNKDYNSYIDDEQSLDYVRLPETYFILPIFEGSSNCLSNLVEFICTSKQRKQILLNSLAKVSKNLKTIIVSIEYDQYSWLESNNNLNIMLEEVNSLVNLIQVQNSLSHFEIYRCPIGFDLVILALRKHLNTLKLIRLVEVKIENYEILNIINDTSRWEIMDIDITEAPHFYDTAVI
jgi:hypothetical protein